MVSQRGGDKEEAQEVASLHRLHGPQQIMSKGSVSLTSHRQAGGRHSRSPTDELHGRVLRI